MAKLRFEIEGKPSGVALQSFVTASSNFLGLLREIDQVVSGRYLGSLRWYISALHSNGGLSVEVYSRLKPAQPKKQVDPDLSKHVAVSLVTGFENVQERGISPPYLSHVGLGRLGNMLDVMARNGVKGYRTTDLETGQSVELSEKASDNMRSLLPIQRKTIGSVEGKLEAISIHNKKRFVVYDALTKKAINCDFNDKAMLDEVKDVLGARVLVSGIVHWNAKSEAKRVDVDKIRTLGASQLPRTLALSGKYPEISDGLSTEEYIRSIRGD